MGTDNNQSKPDRRQKIIEQVAAWLRLFVFPGQVTELRAIRVRRAGQRTHTESGFFDYNHLGKMAAAALTVSPDARGVYFTLNPLNPDLLARHANRLDWAEEGEAAKDADVSQRRWLLIDADPVRDPHVSASAEEKQAALEVVRAVRADLDSRQWPAPLMGDSGNGYHLLYPIDLPADDGGLVQRILQALANKHNTPEACESDKARAALREHAKNSESARAIRAMIDLGRAQPGIPILPDDMDMDPWLFNVRNGTLDLRAGTLREHRRTDHLTKICRLDYHPDATCPTFERFLETIFPKDEDEPDTELITFMQRLLGRCLTGDISEQNLPIFWVGGANGKSTLVNAMLATLGPHYAMKANADLLISSNKDRHPTELAGLFGMRFVVASETQQGRYINEALVKDLTGGEPIRARRMREDFWEFLPTHKTVLLTNHKPRVTGTDEAIWRRLRLVPFEVCFWDPTDPGKDPTQLPGNLRQDKQLGEKLKAEREGILAWLVRGCMDWQRDGLTLPSKVLAGAQRYRNEEDVLARWVEEACQTGDTSHRERSGKLYDAYKDWCERSGETYLTQKQFGPALEEKGYQKKVSDGVWYRGIALTHQRMREE